MAFSPSREPESDPFSSPSWLLKKLTRQNCYAIGINEAGQIAAIANGSVFLLTPVNYPYQPDLWIKQGRAWWGNDVYNHDGTGQTAAQTVGQGTVVVYPARLYNDGAGPETFWIQGSGGNADWTVRYYSGLQVDPSKEVTAKVTSPNGWARRDVPAGAKRDFLIVVTPGLGAVGDFEVLVTSHSVQDPTQLDTLKARTTVPDVQPDLWIKGANWLGDDLYNADGTNQTASRKVPAGVSALFPAQLQNDGAETETFLLKGPAGDGDWTVQYYLGTQVDPNREVTAEVTGADGWKVRLAAGATRRFLVTVTPNSGLSAGSYQALVSAEARRDQAQRDALMTVTQVK